MNLVRAEARRLVKRRFTRWMLVFVVLVLGSVVLGIAATNQKPGPDTLAQAEARAQQEYENNLHWIEEEIRECERSREAGEQGGFDHWPEDCEDIREWYPGPEEMVDWFMPPAFDFRGQFENLLTVFAGVLAMFGFIVGASFVGAEWRSGGMMNLLLWRPRRLRVLGAKLGTLLGGLAGLGVLLAGAWTASFWLVATFRGITDTMTAGAWQSFGLTGLRALVMVLVAGAAGFAIASLGRHTATALGAVLAAFVVGFGVLAVAHAAGARYPEAWFWGSYVDAWMRKSVTFYDYRSCEGFGGFGECLPAELTVTWQVAGVGIGAALVLLVALTMWHMRYRDVT
jgi:ABC-2 type transport system permease protein